jgi:oligoendopeptidase F
MEQRVPKRNEVPAELTWDLSDIYKDTAAWEADGKKAMDLADQLAAMEGRAAESASSLLRAMDLYAECMERTYSVYSYAMMKNDEDTRESAGQELVFRAQSLNTKVSEKISFLEPEILSLPSKTLASYFEKEPGLSAYRVAIRDMVRLKDHSLSKEAERLLASAGEMAQVSVNTFGMLTDADMKFPSVMREGGEIQITGGRFVPLQMSPDRDLRREVFEKFYGTYKQFGNTLASLYDGQIRQQIFFARARKYPSTFEAAVAGVDVSSAVCDNLIESVHRGLDKMYRYVRLRKKMLGVEELHMYDVYTPIVKDFEMKVSYEEAKEISLKALAPLGEDYLAVVRKAYEDRWIDVMENEGKRSGAYSGGVYRVHPYMLLNYNGTLDDVFILVHEMGHSLHTWLSARNQSFLNADYKIFVAEVASTTNELLLIHYLLDRASSREEKAYLINHLLDSFKGTLYRQTMFEEFERKTNLMAEAGQPLTASVLSDTYMELNRLYFGPDMVSDDLIAWEWSRIPHFYYNFYVYQYATSFAAAAAISRKILEGEKGAVENYLKFLSSGCTKDPISLLKTAGVDLSTGKVVDEALEVFEGAIRQMEELFAEE